MAFVFQCARDECRRVFAGGYRPGRGGEYELLQALTPGFPAGVHRVPA